MPLHRDFFAHALRRYAVSVALLLSGGAYAELSPVHTAHAEPAWRIESFCHRGAPPARRCLLQARQGIIVFRLAELAAPPAIHWSDGVAVLTSAGALRFFVPPQQLSAVFGQVRAYDTRERLVAFDAEGRLHLRAMFGDARDLAVFDPPAGVRIDALQLRFESKRLHVRWHDAAGQPHEQVMHAGSG
jgi:hypothetical protein